MKASSISQALKKGERKEPLLSASATNLFHLLLAKVSYSLDHSYDKISSSFILKHDRILNKLNHENNGSLGGNYILPTLDILQMKISINTRRKSKMKSFQ